MRSSRLTALLPAIALLFSHAGHSRGSDSFVEQAVGMEFLYVEGGFFTMGDSLGAGTAKERPAHPVTLSGYHLGRTEVTVDQFRAFTDATGYVTEAERSGSVVDIDARMNTFVRREGVSWRNPGFSQSGSDPVVWVSWNDADAFVRWLGEKTGRPYRLPTEAQWEYAARGGGTASLWSGTDRREELDRYAWHALNSSARTHPVGEKEPNSLGFHDLSGNVWEWCADWQEPYRQDWNGVLDPGGPARGKYRVLRGGSWRVGPEVIRATYRNGYAPGYSHGSIGIRVALPGGENL